MNRPFLRALALCLASLGPVACSSEPETEAPANPDAPEGISVSDGRMTLPAVTGNPAAVYFSITNDSGAPVMIRSAYVAGAGSASLHQTSEWNFKVDMQEISQQPVAAGETVTFEPGGLHVMAFDLEDGLEVGGETEATLTFTGGDKISFPIEIRAPGDGGTDHSAMDMGGGN